MIVRRNFLVVVLCFLVTAGVAGVAWGSGSRTLSAVATRSVKDFGAVGDGKADDTAAIEAAVKTGGGVLYFPKGD